MQYEFNSKEIMAFVQTSGFDKGFEINWSPIMIDTWRNYQSVVRITQIKEQVQV